MTHDEMLDLLGRTQQVLYRARARYREGAAAIQEATLAARQVFMELDDTPEFREEFENVTVDEEEAIARKAATAIGRDFDTDPLFDAERHAIGRYKISSSDEAWLASLNNPPEPA